jgi:hypothetical protein
MRRAAKDKCPNSGKKWSEAENNQIIIEYFIEKRSVDDIADRHGRTLGSIERRFEQIALEFIIKNPNKPWSLELKQIEHTYNNQNKKSGDELINEIQEIVNKFQNICLNP